MLICGLFIASYLIGALPIAYLIGRGQGVDLLNSGSGNLGAHNAYQTLGLRWGLLVWLLDSGKGFAAVWLAGQPIFTRDDVSHITVIALCGLVVVIGHIWSIWGWLLTGKLCVGKGVSTAGGTWLLIAPPGVAALTISLWAGLVGLGGVVPLATLLTFTVGSAWMLILINQERLPVITAVYVLGVAGLIFLRHRENIVKLLAHRERRITRDVPRRALASIGLCGLVSAILSACASGGTPQVTPSVLPIVTIVSGPVVVAPTIVLPPTWTPAPTGTAAPTPTPFPTYTPPATLTDLQLCQNFQIIAAPIANKPIAYDGNATFGWTGGSGDVQLTLLVTIHGSGTTAARVEIPSPADSVLAFPMMKLAADGTFDWSIWLHHSPSVIPNAQGTPQIVTSMPSDILCKHSGTFVRLPVQMM